MTLGRFAPSPTGRMHLGNVFSALLSWLSAKSQNGDWLLRIEDIDPQRSRQQWADHIMQDLEWLGLSWDQGPFYQSQRNDIYGHYLDKLRQLGVIYSSYKTRAERLATSAPQAETATAATAGITAITATAGTTATVPFSGALPQSQQAASALRVTDSIITYTDAHYGLQTIDMRHDIGDFIVRRRDGAWAYQLAVVVDDALMGVTEVVRGRDLLQSAGQQIYLRRLLGFEHPETPETRNLKPETRNRKPEAQKFPELHYAHLPLLCNEAGQRLSKRDKSLDLGTLREHHAAPEIIGHLACLACLIPEYQPITPERLIGTFSWEKVPTEDIICNRSE